MKSKSDTPLTYAQAMAGERGDVMAKLYPGPEQFNPLHADAISFDNPIKSVIRKYRNYKDSGRPVPGIKMLNGGKGIEVSVKWSF